MATRPLFSHDEATTRTNLSAVADDAAPLSGPRRVAPPRPPAESGVRFTAFAREEIVTLRDDDPRVETSADVRAAR